MNKFQWENADCIYSPRTHRLSNIIRVLIYFSRSAINKREFTFLKPFSFLGRSYRIRTKEFLRGPDKQQINGLINWTFRFFPIQKSVTLLLGRTGEAGGGGREANSEEGSGSRRYRNKLN